MVSPPSDMPDHGARRSGPGRAMAAATSVGVAGRQLAAGRSPGPSEWPWPGRSMATSGRPRARATVSHVWAFWAPPCSSTSSGSAVAPHQRAERPAGVDLHQLAAHRGRAVVGRCRTRRRSRGTARTRRTPLAQSRRHDGPRDARRRTPPNRSDARARRRAPVTALRKGGRTGPCARRPWRRRPRRPRWRSRRCRPTAWAAARSSSRPRPGRASARRRSPGGARS